MTHDLDDPYRYLAGIEPVFARLVEEHGRPDPCTWFGSSRTGSSNFAAMVLHIVGQQISTAVAFIVYDRIAAASGGIPTPDGIAALGVDRLRECGLSRAKAISLLELARVQSAGVIDVENMTALDDAEAIAALTAVRGIGVWTAEMFLLHQLHRRDVLPAGDVGIRRAIRTAWELEDLPTVIEVRRRGAAWAPYRSFAALLLWRSLSLT